MRVVVIGAGFSGTMVAVHLAREARGPCEVVLLERSGRFGPGVAYSTRHAVHLLNVPACQMSAFPDDDRHFVRWAKERDPATRDGDFLPRRLFGEYIAWVLEQQKSSPRRGVSIECLRAEATGIDSASSEGVTARLSNGEAISGDLAVLAIGNLPPADPPCSTPGFYESTLYHRDPWASAALDVSKAEDVLVLGTGLTMVDVAAALDRSDHSGTIWCVSRRGLLPQFHRDLSAAPPQLPPPSNVERWPRTALGLLRGLRDEIGRKHAQTSEWRDVVSSLRSATPKLWDALPREERRRFLDHLRPFWETHRHRAAPDIGRTIERLRSEGHLKIIPGRVLCYEERDGEVEVTIRQRGSAAMKVITVARVLNCTGPDTDLSRTRDPLVQSLRNAGTISPDELGLGLATDALGRAISREGQTHASLFVVGPLLRGRLWEHTAVPELRTDAMSCARHVLASRGQVQLGSPCDDS